jgi:hypothetical protein
MTEPTVADVMETLKREFPAIVLPKATSYTNHTGRMVKITTANGRTIPVWPGETVIS